MPWVTKKESEAMQAAIERAETLAALRWTSPIEKDVMPPERDGYSEGWTFNAYTLIVERGWSASTAHGSGPNPINVMSRCGAQGAIRMFSTKGKALAAMRHELEIRAANSLLAIDRRIAELSEKGGEQ